MSKSKPKGKSFDGEFMFLVTFFELNSIVLYIEVKCLIKKKKFN